MTSSKTIKFGRKERLQPKNAIPHLGTYAQISKLSNLALAAIASFF